MVRDDRENAPTGKAIAQNRERSLEGTELVIDGDSYSLKDPREVAGAGARTQDGPDCTDEIVARDERPIFPTPHNFSSQPARSRLVTVLKKNSGKLLLVGGVEESGGAVAAVAHPHVERSAFTKRESARFIVDLMRRNAEVGENAVEFLR